FAEFARLLPLEERFARAQYDMSLWPAMRDAIAARIRERTRDEWAALFEQTDACVAPVLSLAQAPHHPHAKARSAHVGVGPLRRPRPAPRFSRSQTRTSGPAGSGAADALAVFGIPTNEVEALVSAGIVGG